MTNKNSNIIYVEGLEDCYPFEYYDTGKDTFRGIIPDMLSDISVETGLSLVYLSPTESHGKAQLITKLSTGSADIKTFDLLPILTVKQGPQISTAILSSPNWHHPI